ncbi:hypothetical protein SEA_VALENTINIPUFF_15 [Microbacterium phage ValentiniPuff]|uniref:Uncharacterized protein n=1 Tax=Microbacterium phage ValentiniPuff TaxID=2315705 RepID=A0A386KPP7_9CAUD|nr:hypothetical protein SEA_VALENTINIPUFF_15 [Microbacterium phage ValentiniPuff]
MAKRVKNFHAYQDDPARVEQYRQEAMDDLRSRLGAGGLLVVHVWSNKTGEEHEFVLITTGRNGRPTKITYDVGFVLDGDVRDRDGRWTLRRGGGGLTHEDSIRQDLGRLLFGDPMAIELVS